MKIILILLINFIINLASVGPYKENDKISLLVFYETQGFVHDEAIQEGKVMMSKIGNKKNYNIIFAENSNLLEESYLDKIDVIIFLCTTLDVLDEMKKKQ